MAIETLNIDGNELKVADLSPVAQRLVGVYELTHTKRVELENEHIMVSAALRQISTEITTLIREEAEAKTEAVEADTQVEVVGNE
jgi:hypothetical protein